MSLFFQNPALLGLLALAGLPLLVHLISRARPPEFRFSNTEFLRRVIRRTARIRQPKDWLLLLLRSAALLALATAFTAPFIISKEASLPGETATAILLVDRSASMAAREGAGSRFDSACAKATRFLETAHPTAANVIWLDAEPDSVFPEPGPNIRFLTDVLNRAEPLPETGALHAAFDLALRQLATAKGRRELIILSDFQASAWKNFHPSVPPGIVVRTERIATSAPPNIAVTHIVPQPASPLAGQELSILSRVENFSGDPVRTVLTLDADGARQSQPIDLPPWGAAEAVFSLRPSASHSLPVTVQTEPDGFPLDDSRHIVVPVRNSLGLTLETPPDSQEHRIFSKIAASIPWLEITNDRPDIRLVMPWNGDHPERLRDAANSGITLVVRPSPSCPPTALAALLELPEPVSLSLDTSPDGWAVNPEESHPATQLFRHGDFGNPFAGTFRERLRLPTVLAAAPSAQTIARFSDGVPAIVEFTTSSASILLWNLPTAPELTDWPIQGSFLPSVAEILLRTRPRGVLDPHQLLPGSHLTWSSPDPSHAEAISLIGPDGNPIPVRKTTDSSGILWETETTASPGMHRWQISGQTIDFTAVNFPDSESDLRPLDAPPAFTNSTSGNDSLIRSAILSQGIPLAPALLIAALAALGLESLIHFRKNGAPTSVGPA